MKELPSTIGCHRHYHFNPCNGSMLLSSFQFCFGMHHGSYQLFIHHDVGIQRAMGTIPFEGGRGMMGSSHKLPIGRHELKFRLWIGVVQNLGSDRSDAPIGRGTVREASNIRGVHVGGKGACSILVGIELDKVIKAWDVQVCSFGVISGQIDIRIVWCGPSFQFRLVQGTTGTFPSTRFCPDSIAGGPFFRRGFHVIKGCGTVDGLILKVIQDICIETNILGREMSTGVRDNGILLSVISNGPWKGIFI